MASRVYQCLFLQCRTLGAFRQQERSDFQGMANKPVQTRQLIRMGFTLLELLTVMAIMGTLASIAVPVYINYVNQAKNNICINDIRSIQQEIELLRDQNGRLPDCLDELPGGNRLDPWGNPYQYLNYEATEKEKGGGGGEVRRRRAAATAAATATAGERKSRGKTDSCIRSIRTMISTVWGPTARPTHRLRPRPAKTTLSGPTTAHTSALRPTFERLKRRWTGPTPF